MDGVLKNPLQRSQEGNKEIENKIKTISELYGYDAQSRQCIEEMAELTQAINKFWRKDLKCGCEHNYLWDRSIPKETETYKNMLEEIADVQIMLWQMEYLLNADVSPIIEQKLDRQLERIKGNGKT